MARRRRETRQERCAQSAPSKSRESGAGERDRTADLPFTRRPLCQLSYTGWVVLMVAETSSAAPDGNAWAAACALSQKFARTNRRIG
jgi:hypothetical protein